MGEWVVWLVVAVLLGFGELHTGGFFLAPFAVGALVATIVALAGAGFVLAGPAFLIASAAVLVGLRPVAARHRRLPPPTRTGAAALVGRHALVVERIANREADGCVRIDGELWTARSFDDDVVVEPGSDVQVVEIRGATALVMQ